MVPPHPIAMKLPFSLSMLFSCVCILKVPQQRVTDLFSTDSTSERDLLFLPALTGNWAEGNRNSSPLILPSKKHYHLIIAKL